MRRGARPTSGQPTHWTDMSPLAGNDTAAREAARIGSRMLLERIHALQLKMEGKA